MHKIVKIKRNTSSIAFKKVDYIPDILENNVLYISDKFNVAVHKCICGCNNEVVTALDENYWSYTINDSGVSMYPSIGNWGFNCRSHYWINNGKILWR